MGMEFTLDWNSWLNGAQNSKRLTPLGKNFTSKMVETFIEFFGENPIQDPGFIFWAPAVAGLHPVNDVPQVYYRLTNLYALIRLAQDGKTPGFHKLRKNIAHSPSGESFRHLTMQLEMAGFAFRDGDSVEFEPKLGTDGKKTADVRIQYLTAGQKLDMELCSLRIAQETVETTAYYDDFEEFLIRLCFEFDVQIRGKLSGIPPSKYMEDIANTMRKTARTVSKYGGRKQRNTKWYRLTFTPKNGDMPFPELVQKVPQRDWWPRYYSTIKKKAMKTPNDAIWIRFDDVSGFFHFSHFSLTSLQDRLKILALNSKQLFMAFPNLRGIVLTNHGDILFDQDQVSNYGINVAIRRKLPTLFTRETFILPRDESESNTVKKLASWFESEHTWLPWALHTLRMPDLSMIAPLENSQVQ